MTAKKQMASSIKYLNYIVLAGTASQHLGLLLARTEEAHPWALHVVTAERLMQHISCFVSESVWPSNDNLQSHSPASAEQPD